MRILVNGHEVKAQILPVDKPTLDETLETFSFALISDSNAMPYAPCQNVQVITDSNEKINLFLVSDNVEIYSVSPAKWKHTITCVQNTRKLSKHLVRNSSFTTPPYLEKRSYTAVTSCILVSPVSGSLDHVYSYGIAPFCQNNFIEEKVTLRDINGYTREKVKNAYFKLKIQGVRRERLNAPYIWKDNINDISVVYDESTPLIPNFQFNNNLILKYRYASGGGTIQESLDPDSLGVVNGWYPVDQKLRFNRVEELAREGAIEFSIGFDGSMVSGSYQSDSEHAEVYPYLCFQIEIILETYNYNVYEILDLLKWRQMKQRRLQIGGNFVNENPLFLLKDSGELHDLLVSTPAPNFIFTQSTMYECLAEVFRLFDAIFTMDENGYLDIEYFNEQNGRDVTSTLKKVGQNSSSSEDKYTNGLVAYYQNAKNVHEFPSAKGMMCATIKTKELAVPSSNNSFIFETDHPIDETVEAQIVVLNKGIRLMQSQDVPEINIDAGSGLTLNISHYLVNEELWTILDNSKDLNNDFSYKQQINTIFFKKGTNEIDVSYTYNRYWFSTVQFAFNNMNDCALARQFGMRERLTYGYMLVNETSTPAWSSYGLKIKYIATNDGRVKIESPDRKYDGETLVDQYNGAVDLNKMGVNILGLTLKLGNPTLTVTQRITNWNDRIKTGDIYRYEGKNWIANVVAYTILGGGKVQATIQFVQNFNALSMRTQLLREKRMSNISQELTLKSEENIVEYVYFTTERKPVPLTISPNYISINAESLAKSLAKSLGRGLSTSYPTIEMAGLTPYGDENQGIYHIPLHKYGAGNCMCFEVSYDDPMLVGKQTKNYEGTNAWFTGDDSTKYFTTAIKYTNENGEFANATIRFYGDVQVSSMPLDNFPVLNGFIATTMIHIENYYCLKQSNEIFALNYQLCFLPIDSDKDFIGSKFINNNYLIDGTIRNPSNLKIYYRNDDFKYSILDTKGSGSRKAVTSVTFEYVGLLSVVMSFHFSGSINATSFAICENDGTILFASNRPVSDNKVGLSFYTTHYRQDKKVLSDL